MSREDYAKEAYYDGRDAARNGGGDNPFPWGCYEHAAWARGYEAAQDLDPLEQLTRALLKGDET